MVPRLVVSRVVGAALGLLLGPAIGLGQLPQPPVPLYPGAPPRSYEPRSFEPHSFETEPLPPIAPAPETARSPDMPPPAEIARPAAPPGAASVSAPMSAPTGRIFCEQSVAVRLADSRAVPEPFRPFIGIWSDASWTPLLCAALIVEQAAPDGAATIVYVFGPMGTNPRAAGGTGGGVLHGTGIIRDGELRFQNSDGSQFAFRPVYADLGGRLTTAQGQSYQAIFKKTP
jgi:hypothetical protein